MHEFESAHGELGVNRDGQSSVRLHPDSERQHPQDPLGDSGLTATITSKTSVPDRHTAGVVWPRSKPGTIAPWDSRERSRSIDDKTTNAASHDLPAVGAARRGVPPETTLHFDGSRGPL